MIDEIRLNRRCEGSKQARAFAYASGEYIVKYIEHLRHRRFSATELLNSQRFMTRDRRVQLLEGGRGRENEGRRERMSAKKIEAARMLLRFANGSRRDAQPLKVTGVRARAALLPSPLPTYVN